MPKRRTRGDGGLIQRHDHPDCPPLVDGVRPEHTCRGRWVGTLDATTPDGRRKRKYVYGRTQKEAQRKLREALRQRDAGTLVVDGTTVKAWLTHWLDHIAARSLKPSTLRTYRGYVDKHLIPRLGDKRLTDLRPEHVRWLHDALAAADLKPATVLQVHAILSKSLNDAVRDGKLTTNPCDAAGRPKAPKNHRRGLTLEQASRVLHSTDDLRWWLALFYGMRQGEVLALRWRDVDLDAHVIRIERTLVTIGGKQEFGTPKSQTSRRTIPLLPRVEARVRLLLTEAGDPDPDALLFAKPDGTPLHPRTDWAAWRELLAANKVEPVALHAARNSAASLMEAAGIPDRVIAQILGHSSVQITHGYQHAEVARMLTELRKLEALVEAPAAASTTPASETPRALPASPSTP